MLGSGGAPRPAGRGSRTRAPRPARYSPLERLPGLIASGPMLRASGPLGDSRCTRVTVLARSPCGTAILGPIPWDSAGRRSSDVTYIIAQPCVDLLDKSCIEEC